MGHASRSAARRHRRRLATGWVPPSDDDVLPAVALTKRGQPVTIERTIGSPRRDMFRYDGARIVGLTSLATHNGYALP